MSMVLFCPSRPNPSPNPNPNQPLIKILKKRSKIPNGHHSDPPCALIKLALGES